MIGKIRKIQKNGLKKWENNSKFGILEHATGSGKTVSALKAMARHLQDRGNVFVLVPSRLLLQQWYDEISQAFPNLIVRRIGDGHKETNTLKLMRNPSRKK